MSSSFRDEGKLHPKRVTLGSVELAQPLGIGTMQWGTTWLDSKINREGLLSNAVLDNVVSTAVKKGIQFFDTAEYVLS